MLVVAGGDLAADGGTFLTALPNVAEGQVCRRCATNSRILDAIPFPSMIFTVQASLAAVSTAALALGTAPAKIAADATAAMVAPDSARSRSAALRLTECARDAGPCMSAPVLLRLGIGGIFSRVRKGSWRARQIRPVVFVVSKRNSPRAA